MNIYDFNLNDAVSGLFTFYFMGIVTGALMLGLLRFLFLNVFERRES